MFCEKCGKEIPEGSSICKYCTPETKTVTPPVNGSTPPVKSSTPPVNKSTPPASKSTTPANKSTPPKKFNSNMLLKVLSIVLASLLLIVSIVGYLGYQKLNHSLTTLKQEKTDLEQRITDATDANSALRDENTNLVNQNNEFKSAKATATKAPTVFPSTSPTASPGQANHVDETSQAFLDFGDFTNNDSRMPIVTSSVASGNYTTIQYVQLSTADTTNKIYYTLDGSVPTDASTPYKGQIELGEGDITLKCVAYTSDRKRGRTCLEKYSITVKEKTTPFSTLSFKTFSVNPADWIDQLVQANWDPNTDLDANDHSYNNGIKIQMYDTDYYQSDVQKGDLITQTMEYALEGNYSKLEGKFVLHKESASDEHRTRLVFYGDDKEIFASSYSYAGVEPIDISVDLTDVKTLKLVVETTSTRSSSRKTFQYGLVDAVLYDVKQ